MSMRPGHEWFQVEFVYASWTECTCGFRPGSEPAFFAHQEKNQ